MNKKLFTYSIVFSFLLASCDFHNRTVVVGTGEVESMEVEVPPFTGVNVIGLCDVEITVGGDQYLELRAQSEILEVLTTTVRNGILEIGYEPHMQIKPGKKISAQINIPELDFIGVSGSGNFYLQGEAQPSLDILIEGTCDVDAYNLEVARCNIFIEGSGNCHVNVTEQLDVDISGAGSISYMGSPEINQSISGVGSVKQQ